MPAPEIRKIRALAGGAGEATVDLVEIDGVQYVLKRQTKHHAALERLFQQTLADAGLPSLRIVDHPSLRPDQILLEYVEGSTTVGGSPSAEVCEHWGVAVARLHAIRSDGFMALDAGARPTLADWPDFLRRTARSGLEAQRLHLGGMPAMLLDRIARKLDALTNFRPKVFAVSHGDLHVNNALCRADQIVLFDKAASLWSAPPVFDVALIYAEAFPGSRYVAGPARAGDDERLAAFMAGYGALPAEQEAWIDHFVLLHALNRYPSPFVPDLRSVVEAALQRI